ncbi:hypothetical protein P3G55_24390, partial [Leptospira sp. 96542]|nr:hypothetical protein [Leptospira sp. 96542]
MVDLQRWVGFGVCLVMPWCAQGPLHAQTAPVSMTVDPQPAPPGAQEPRYKPCDVSRLQPHEPSYGVYQKAKGDEPALRAHYSFRYVLDPVPDKMSVEHTAGSPCLLRSDFDAGWYLKYTGEFDF